jgi:hypothetical protein
MKLQFSLATLLVCIPMLAVVCAVAVALPVQQTFYFASTGNEGPLPVGYFRYPTKTDAVQYLRPPNLSEIAWRLAVWGPLAFATTTPLALWLIRRLKSRRENGPPVG